MDEKVLRFIKKVESVPSVEIVDSAFVQILKGKVSRETKRAEDDRGLARLDYRVEKEAGEDGYYEYSYDRDGDVPVIYRTDYDSLDFPGGGETVARYTDGVMWIL